MEIQTVQSFRKLDRKKQINKIMSLKGFFLNYIKYLKFPELTLDHIKYF